ncbi:MAG: Eco57I restriction-modification methylase domain-containing protein [Acidimicrobiales bacterium]
MGVEVGVVSVSRQLQLIESPVTLGEPAAGPGANYGEVFTRRWVVDLILDLVGYTPDRDLASMVLVEPSCGSGAFLGPIVDRLIESAESHGRDLRSVHGALRAFDVLEANAELARKAVGERLQEAGLTPVDADAAVRRWVTTADFLLHEHEPATVDFVVGNPPYIRLENVPATVMAAYRRTCPTMRGRSDIYIGFIERGLDLLRPRGVLGYICADRWMRNQYGAALRDLITRSYSVDTVVTMHDVDAFEDDVSAYPAVVVLRNDVQRHTNVVEANGRFGEVDSAKVAAWAQNLRNRRRRSLTAPSFEASRVDGWFGGRDLWPAGSPARLAVLADLEARFPPLEDVSTGTRVGIGVATGCDDVYITNDPELVESGRSLPLLQAPDISSGSIEWQGQYLVNPWDDGKLVDLAEYPRLARHYFAHATELRARHVAKKRPTQWYRTIDRVDPTLLTRRKLVIPDLKAAAHPVLDDGAYYPHHNLYFVVSDAWDLEVLGGLLLSDVANLFVGAYCVRMRGGCYRFQAQYVRRIRVPLCESVGKGDRRALAAAFSDRDVGAATATALRLYGISELPTLR